MFGMLKTWTNAPQPGAHTRNGRTWTRRIQWLEDSEGNVKLKMECVNGYKEALVQQADAGTVWRRFKDGQSIDDCLSIYGSPVPPPMKSRRAAKEDK